VYDGDRLQSPQGGSLRVQFGAQQLVLRKDTAAQVHAIPNGFSANLNGGSIVASSAAGQTFEIYADGATIAPANSEPASAQITMLNAKQLVLTGNRGVLKVTMGEEVKTLEAGSSYRLEVAEDADPGAQPQAPSPTARNHFLWILIPAVAAVTGVVI